MKIRGVLNGSVLRGRSERWHEGVTMAIYINLSLLAVLLVIPEDTESSAELAVTLIAAAISLMIAHSLAFRLSGRLMHGGDDDESHDTKGLLLAQTAGGSTAAVIATLPVLLFGTEGLSISENLLLAFVCVIGFITSRSGGASVLRALGYVVGLVLLVLAVAILKSLNSH